MFHKNTNKHPQNVLYETEQWHAWNNTLAGEDTDTQTHKIQTHKQNIHKMQTHKHKIDKIQTRKHRKMIFEAWRGEKEEVMGTMIKSPAMLLVQVRTTQVNVNEDEEEKMMSSVPSSNCTTMQTHKQWSVHIVKRPVRYIYSFKFEILEVRELFANCLVVLRNCPP